jgi:hypothetical protein
MICAAIGLRFFSTAYPSWTEVDPSRAPKLVKKRED